MRLALTCTVLAVLATACSQGSSTQAAPTAPPPSALGPQVTEAQGAGAAVLPGILPRSPEPTPYAVPTTPATDALEVIRPTESLSAQDDESDVPWTLIRLWNGGQSFAISYAFGCNEPGRVLVEDTAKAVTVRVLRPPVKDGPQPACASTYRKEIRLNAPLSERQLLHVVV